MIIASQAEPYQSPRADVPKAGLIISNWALPSVFVALLFRRCSVMHMLMQGETRGCSVAPTITPQAVDQCRATAPTTWSVLASSGPLERFEKKLRRKIKILGLVFDRWSAAGMRFVQSSRRC